MNMKYRKKPVVIEAEQFDTFSNKVYEGTCDKAHYGYLGETHIHTLEGQMTVQHGDWIIKGVKGEFYPCKPDIFEMTYELVK